VHDIPPKKPVDITGSEHDDKENEIGEKKENPLPSAIDSKKKDAARNKPRSKSLPNIESNLANRPPKNDAVENIPKQDSVPPKPAEDLENRPAATFTDEEDTLTQEKDEEDTKEKEIPPSTTQPPAAPNYAQPTAASDPVQPAAAPDPVQPAAAPGPVVNGDEGDIVTQEENKKLVDLTGSEHDDEDNEIGKKEESRPSSPIDPSDQKNDVANARPRRNSLPNLQSAVENRPPNSVRPRSNSVTNLRGEIHKHEDPIEKILHSTPVFGGNRGLGDG
jgi:hypothetical protein